MFYFCHSVTSSYMFCACILYFLCCLLLFLNHLPAWGHGVFLHNWINYFYGMTSNPLNTIYVINIFWLSSIFGLFGSFGSQRFYIFYRQDLWILPSAILKVLLYSPAIRISSISFFFGVSFTCYYFLVKLRFVLVYLVYFVWVIPTLIFT